MRGVAPNQYSSPASAATSPTISSAGDRIPPRAAISASSHEPGAGHPLVGTRAVLDDCDRRVGWRAVLDEPVRNDREPARAHVERKRLPLARKRLPVDGIDGLATVRGHEPERLRMLHDV